MNDNITKVGDKPIMAYVTSVSMHFLNGEKEAKIVARGKFISRAVDVLEVVKKKVNNITEAIKTGSESMKEMRKDEAGKEKEITREVSYIEITLRRT